MAKGSDMEKTRLGESGDVLIKFEIRVMSYTKELDMVGEGYGGTGNIDRWTRWHCMSDRDTCAKNDGCKAIMQVPGMEGK